MILKQDISVNQQIVVENVEHAHLIYVALKRKEFLNMNMKKS